MADFENMIHKLKNDVEIPEKIWAEYKQVLLELPDKKEKRIKKGWLTIVASAAMIFLTAGTICVTNPALAAKIPVIGKIFDIIQQSVVFSGNYSDKAQSLVSEPDNTTDVKNSIYTTEDGGIKITASEIYSDGYSIYMAAEISVAQGGLQNMLGNIMYLEGDWQLAGDAEKNRIIENKLEGQIIDDNTFVGMIKLDMDNLEMQKGEVLLSLSMVGYDDRTIELAQDISASCKYKGEWSLQIPFTVDKDTAKTFVVDKEKDGYHIDKVFVSPYQVIAYVDVPYTERVITEEEFEQTMREKTGGSGEFGITYEEYIQKKGKNYQPYYTAVCNQDGELLKSMGEYQGYSVYAVQNIQISKLYIYLFDDASMWEKIERDGITQEYAEKAIVCAEIEVE